MRQGGKEIYDSLITECLNCFEGCLRVGGLIEHDSEAAERAVNAVVHCLIQYQSKVHGDILSILKDHLRDPQSSYL